MRLLVNHLTLIVAGLLCLQVVADKFGECKHRIERILNGTENYNSVNNVSIHSLGYIYTGHVFGINPEYAKTSRDQLLTVTTKGWKYSLTDQEPVLMSGRLSSDMW